MGAGSQGPRAQQEDSPRALPGPSRPLFLDTVPSPHPRDSRKISHSRSPPFLSPVFTLMNCPGCGAVRGSGSEQASQAKESS